MLSIFSKSLESREGTNVSGVMWKMGGKVPLLSFFWASEGELGLLEKTGSRVYACLGVVYVAWILVDGAKS
jgi:hypothetical protein